MQTHPLEGCWGYNNKEDRTPSFQLPGRDLGIQRSNQNHIPHFCFPMTCLSGLLGWEPTVSNFEKAKLPPGGPPGSCPWFILQECSVKTQLRAWDKVLHPMHCPWGCESYPRYWPVKRMLQSQLMHCNHGNWQASKEEALLTGLWLMQQDRLLPQAMATSLSASSSGTWRLWAGMFWAHMQTLSPVLPMKLCPEEPNGHCYPILASQAGGGRRSNPPQTPVAQCKVK